MPVLSYGQSNFGIALPIGRYVARFLGTESRPPIQGGQFGNDGEPRMAFIFEVTAGDKTGERIIQETGTTPSPKSECARMLLGLAGRELQVKEKVNTDDFIGKTYSVKVGVNPKSDKGRLHVADMEPFTATAPANGGAPQRPAGGPPPRPTAPAAPATGSPPANYFVDHAKCQFDETLNTEKVRELIFAEGLKAADLALCKEGDREWKSAAAYGFEDSPIR